MDSLPDLLTAFDVAIWLGMPVRKVESLARTGTIPATEILDGVLRFDRNDLLRWLEKRPAVKQHDLAPLSAG